MDSPLTVLAVLVASISAGLGLQHLRPSGVPRPVAAGRTRRNVAVGIVVFVVGAASGGLLVGPAAVAEDHGWGLMRWLHLPAPMAAVGSLIGLEVAFYWLHRAAHRHPVLWRVHRAHHTDVAMDLSTSLRSHPFDLILANLTLGAAALVLGMSPVVVVVYNLASLAITFLQHADVAIGDRVDRALSAVLMTSSSHRMHHSAARVETDSNYGGLSMFPDRWFGTRTAPALPVALGLDLADLDRRQSVAAILLDPFRSPPVATASHGVTEVVAAGAR